MCDTARWVCGSESRPLGFDCPGTIGVAVVLLHSSEGKGSDLAKFTRPPTAGPTLGTRRGIDSRSQTQPSGYAVASCPSAPREEEKPGDRRPCHAWQPACTPSRKPTEGRRAKDHQATT